VTGEGEKGKVWARMHGQEQRFEEYNVRCSQACARDSRCPGAHQEGRGKASMQGSEAGKRQGPNQHCTCTA
jgi:hypothetical protein